MRQHAVLSLAACLLGCPADGTSSEWRVLFATPALGERAVAVRLEILEGGCDGEVLHAEDIRRDSTATMPPTLRGGRHGFRAVARDVACTEFALDCREVVFPADAGTITLTLSPIMDRPLCGGDACVDGECGPCIDERRDCDGDSTNGCEVDVSTSSIHCGDCGLTCERANASASCNAGTCELGACNDGFDDCDGDASNGCEADLQSTEHCGSCDRACLGAALCNDGSCSLLECDPGTADCDEVPDNGCEVDTLTSAVHCGTCGRSCGIGGTCQQGRCDDEIVEMVSPFVFFFLQTRAILAGGRLVQFPSIGAGRRAFSYLGVDDAVGVFSALSFQCYLRANGELVCNDFNQSPRRTLATDIAVMSSRDTARLEATEVCAVRLDGSAACWRDGEGDPRELAGRDYVKIETGAYLCGARADGTVECSAGHQPATQCGPPDGSAPPTELELPPSSTFSFSIENFCAIDTSGILRCSGENDFGQVANRRTSACEMASEVAPLTGVVDVDTSFGAGVSGACAVTDAGELWCWGRLPGVVSDATEPVRIAGVTNAAEIDMAGTCIGILGRDGIFSQSEACIGGATQQSARGAVEVATGDSHTCARRINGRVACWGLNLEGQLGDGTFDSRSVPTLLTDAPNATRISAGARHTCIVSEAAEVWCWGDNSEAQLGNGSGANVATPTRVEGLSEIEDVRAGDGHTCARSRDDQVWCWGDNSANQISDTAPDLIESPLMLSGVDFVDVRGDSTCVREGGFVICSGANTANFNASPILEIETTDTAACAIGVVDFHCAGTHLDPATGNTMTTTTATRYQIDGGAFLNEVAIGPNHACAATADGVLRCWGDNSSGQLGVPSATLSRGVATVDLAGVTTVDVGLRHTCARTVQGEVHCFGSGTFGQLGDGMMRDQSSPVEALELR